MTEPIHASTPASDDTPADQAPAPDQQAPDAAATDQPGADEHGDHQAAGREAAKYRTRLREVEAERDQLLTQLQAMRRREAERYAETAGLKPVALWAAGTDLADLLADDGTVASDKVAAAVKAARDYLGIQPLPKAPPAIGQGDLAGGSVHDRAGRPGAFADAFKPRR